jgi:hypothetical protein
MWWAKVVCGDRINELRVSFFTALQASRLAGRLWLLQ